MCKEILNSAEQSLFHTEQFLSDYNRDVEKSYIIKQGDTYIIYTVDIEVVIDENVAQILLEERLSLKECE